ncbi:uncharacterized protein LOC135486673 isoform X2 [Lineus longissimus]|uniref:uncharacterized protein LOC135486673 isoform X2 n=1 Tax=Lineus longissimus TaxID=88925 RepID=UPI00315D0813
MAVEYLNVLNSLDLGLHSKELFKKTMKRRPLGDIETRHAVRAPRNPVLSMRLVDVSDVAQKTSYRPKSSSDIVERQREEFHRLCARSAKSASVPRPKHSQEENRNKPYTTIIQVKGENTHKASNRPQSCPNTLLTSSWRNPALKRPTSGPQRPKTSASGSSTPQTESRLTVQIDPEYYERSLAKKQCESQIGTHRKDENHNLNVGIFIRGKKKEGQTDKDTQWLTFGGGVRNSAGVVDAFSVMKNSEEYFSIDGRTGMVVAKNLQKTDKVQIGVNGRLSKTTSSRTLQSTQNNASEEQNKDLPDMGQVGVKDEIKEPVPLCWSDQLKKPEVKVWTARGEQSEKQKPSVSETKPVIFNKLLPEEEKPSQLVSPRRMPSPDGYKVRQRTKIRKWLDGTDTNFMTILSIDARGEEEDKDLELVDYEKLINDQFQPRETGRKYPREGPPMRYNEINSRRVMSGNRKPSGRSTARSGTADSNRSYDPKNLVRPTSRSISSGTLSGGSPLKVTPASPTSRAAPVRTIVTQPQKQQSPQAGKIIRGKTSDKMGRTPPSISANYNQGDTSFIQITQSVGPTPGQVDDAHISNKDVSSVHENSYTMDFSTEKQDFRGPGYYGDTVPAGMNTPVSMTSQLHNTPHPIDVPAVDMVSEGTSVCEVDEHKMINAESLQEIPEADDAAETKDPGNITEIKDDDDAEEEGESRDVRKMIPAPSPVAPSQAPQSEMEDPLLIANITETEKTEIEEKEFNISVSIKPRDMSGENTPEDGSVHMDSGRQSPEN